MTATFMTVSTTNLASRLVFPWQAFVYFFILASLASTASSGHSSGGPESLADAQDVALFRIAVDQGGVEMEESVSGMVLLQMKAMSIQNYQDMMPDWIPAPQSPQVQTVADRSLLDTESPDGYLWTPLQDSSSDIVLPDEQDIATTEVSPVDRINWIDDVHWNMAPVSPSDIIQQSLLLQTSAAAVIGISNGSTVGNATQGSAASDEDTDDGHEYLGISKNKDGDLTILLTALASNVVFIVIIILLFSWARLKFYPVLHHIGYDKIYSGDRIKNWGVDPAAAVDEDDIHSERRILPPADESTFFGWAVASVSLKEKMVINGAGLDEWMILEFFHLGMKLFALLMVPMILIMAPLHVVFGRPSDDYLGVHEISNLEDGHWLFWIHALLVWYVVLVTLFLVTNAQKGFLEPRYAWLEAMPDPRATTILVEGIPWNLATDRRLADYFNRVFLDKELHEHQVAVEEVHVVKQTQQLAKDIAVMKEDVKRLERARKSGKPELINELQTKLDNDKNKVQADRELIFKQIEDIEEKERKGEEVTEEEISAVYSNAGFVTFKRRHDSEMALRLLYTQDDGEFECSYPPDPSDVLYKDLQEGTKTVLIEQTIGYIAIMLLFFGFLPVIIGFEYLLNIDRLRDSYSVVNEWCEGHPGITAVYEANVGTLVLIFFMSFLPTVLVWIFKFFFLLRAEAWLQLFVLRVYYPFLIVYVLLAPALGTSVIASFRDLWTDPSSFFNMLNEQMAGCSHFYLKYITVQWATYAWAIFRFDVLVSFEMKRWMYESEEYAAELAEPEDQDYYGIGSRSARFTLVFVICLTFCQISPIITIFGFLAACFGRLVYGYLVVYAETQKPDLGGEFWVQTLINLQIGLFIYILLMTAVVCYRSPSYGPGIIAGSAVFFQVIAVYILMHKYHWERLPISHIEKEDHAVYRNKARRVTYSQPELYEPIDEVIGEPVRNQTSGSSQPNTASAANGGYVPMQDAASAENAIPLENLGGEEFRIGSENIDPAQTSTETADNSPTRLSYFGFK